jgi:prolyl-tRNA synthetase
MCRCSTSEALDQTELLYAEALAFRDAHTVDVTDIEQAVEAARTGWARIPWKSLGVEGEATLAGQGITVRCLVLPDGSVPATDEVDDALAVVGRAY